MERQAMSQFTDEVKKMASATDTTSTEKKKVVTVTDPKVDAAVREKLVVSRIALLLKAPFFGTLATRLDLVNADDWLSTAATDGRKFYYNSEFVNKLPPKQVEFLMGHEVLHVVYDHMGRRGDRQPALSNIAADYAVNQDLIDQRIGEKITVVPILYDKRWTGMSYEEIYDKLYDEADKIDIDSLLKQLLDDHPDEDDEGEVLVVRARARVPVVCPKKSVVHFAMRSVRLCSRLRRALAVPVTCPQVSAA